uniref:DNA mismatch repair proteins mutS family domain-containing protein n=1 Tax=Globodera rostochiensis TaxID=31243 RepID=A0A914HV56_GLORO
MLFSTHYHSLCNFVANEAGIALAHMACMVENADLDDPTMEAITFLYTLADGMCDKSYGFYTAKMAGLNAEVIRRASQAANQLSDKGGGVGE